MNWGDYAVGLCSGMFLASCALVGYARRRRRYDLMAARRREWERQALRRIVEDRDALRDALEEIRALGEGG